MAKPRDALNDFADQRKYPRSGVILPGQFEAGGEVIDCTVMNLSANGAKLKLRSPLADSVGSGIVTIPRLGTFSATIAWCASTGRKVIGLTFQDPPDEVARKLSGIMPKSRAATFP